MPEAGRASVKFVGDYSALMAGLTSTLGGSKLKSVGLKAGGALAAGFVASKAVDELMKAVNVTKEFDKQISSLGAVAGASNKQMEALRKQAIKMGADTVFSATEAAQAQTELAKGGLNASQILGGALKSSLDLAAAGELDLADAAETTVNAMQLFGLAGRDTSKIADMLATAANKTTADVLDFAMSLKQGGAVAKTAGYSLNDTVVVLEALAEAGIKNSDAGTSMKAALIQLLNPTKKQAELAEKLHISWLSQNGELKTAVGISKQLKTATEGMSKAERTKTLAILAGTDGFRTLSALYDAGVGKLRAYAKANQEQGTAAEDAARKTDNLAGDTEQLSGAWETFQLTLGSKVTPALRDVTQVATKAVNAVTKIFSDKTLSGGEKFQKVIDLAVRGAVKGLEELTKAAVKAAPEVASAFASGFASAPIWMQLAGVGLMLKMFGGPGGITRAGATIGTRFATSFAAGFRVNEALGGTFSQNIGAGMGALGRTTAAKFMAGLSKWIAPMAATYAIGDVLTTAISGDTEDALRKAGATLAGAGIGFAVGGPVGAAIGAGIGDGLSGSLGGVFDSIFSSGLADADALKPLKTLSERAREAAKARVAANNVVAQSTKRLNRLQEQLTGSNRRVKRAEDALGEARRRYGEDSLPAIRAEKRLGDEKRRNLSLTNRLKNADRLHGEVREAQKKISAFEIASNRALVKQKKREVDVDKRAVKLAGARGAGYKVLKPLVERLNKSSNELNKAQRQSNRALAEAESKIGPKWVESIKSMTFYQLKNAARSREVAAAYRVGQEAIRGSTKENSRLFGAIAKGGPKSQRLMDGLAGSIADMSQEGRGNWRALLRVQKGSTKGMTNDVEHVLDVIKNLGTPQAKRHGGLIERLRQRFRDGGVPVALSSGEVYKLPDGKAGVVPGRPTAADNVLTSMPVGTKIFTFDGQRRLMEGASESQALRDQLPHFASGGIVKPEITGGTKRGAEVANAAVGKVYSAAKAKLKKERMQNRFGTGGGANFQGKLVADWIVPILKWAQAHGWSGSITSGYRDPGQVVSNAQGIVAPQGQSNHNSLKYPGGAIDVGDPGARAAGQALASVLAGYPGNPKLVWGGPVINDWGHFSATGHRRGGIIEALRQHFRSGGYAAGIWAGSQIDKMYPKSDGYSGAKLPPYLIKALAEYFGLPGVTMEQITQGESMGRPGVDISDPPGRSRGLYAINDHYNGQYGTDKLRNPIYNTWVAKQLADAAGGPNPNIWHGSSHVTGWNQHYDADGEKIRRIAKRFGGGGSESQGMSPAEKAKAASKSRRENREKRVKELLRKGSYWPLFNLFANYGDFERRASKYGGVGPGMDEASSFLSRVGAAASVANPNNRLGRLGSVARWLIGNVDMTGVEDANERLARRLSTVQDRSGKRASKRRDRILSKIARFGEDSPWGKRLNKNASWIELLTERIGNAEREHGAPWSAGGSEYTDAEVANEVGLNRRKLTAENRRYRMFTAAIPYFTAAADRYRKLIDRAGPKDRWKVPGWRKGLRGATANLKAARSGLNSLVGLTGDGGTRGDTYFRLRELGFTDTVEKVAAATANAGISIGDLRGIVDFAALGGYRDMPILHRGGIYRAAPGQTEGPALLQDGETVRTKEQERALRSGNVTFQVKFRDDRLKDLIEITMDDRDREVDQHMKAAGV